MEQPPDQPDCSFLPSPNVFSRSAPTVRVSGVDLKIGEQLVRRLALHHHLLPIYRSLPPHYSTTAASSTLTKLLADSSCFTSILPASIDPSWRAHEQEHPQKNAVEKQNGARSKAARLGGVPPERASRKREQLIALIRVLSPLILARIDDDDDDEALSIVDFCAGCGHVGLLIAALFPQVTVTLLDVKPIALGIASKRADAAGLKNLRTVQCSILDIPNDVRFDIAVALHACGDASDDVLTVAAQRRAAIVVAPCCVGSLASPISSSHLGKSNNNTQNIPINDAEHGSNNLSIVDDNSFDKEDVSSTHTDDVAPQSVALSKFITANEFALLARAADFGELATGKDHWRGIAKMMIEKDRLTGLLEKGYSCSMLVKMRPEHCTPKNDVLVVWPPGLSNDEETAILEAWPVDQRANGAIDDFLDSSVLRGLGADEVNAVERMLRDVVCGPDSPGVYFSPPGGGKRARKVVHAVAAGLNLTHESVGRSVSRQVVVTRHKYWPVFFDHYLGVGGPHVDSTAKKLSSLIPTEYAERRHFVRGGAHHVTIVSPPELGRMLSKFQGDNEACLELCYQQLVGSTFHIIGIGTVTKQMEIDGEKRTEEKSYFAAVEWPEAQQFRKKLGLKAHDFHITLGFKNKDVHGLAKDASTLIHSFDLTCSPWLS